MLQPEEDVKKKVKTRNGQMKGIYVLLIELRKDTQVTVGKLLEIDFKKGYYAYVGSALNGLESRIKRHLSHKKKFHWHIDYFLEKSDITSIIYAETLEKKECKLAETLNEFENIRNFGSSDCNCESHLCFSCDFEKLRGSVIHGFGKNNLEYFESVQLVNVEMFNK